MVYSQIALKCLFCSKTVVLKEETTQELSRGTRIVQSEEIIELQGEVISILNTETGERTIHCVYLREEKKCYLKENICKLLV